MQTFLPFPNFEKSAACLDKRRCLKQVVEAKQIIDILQGKQNRWKNHPAVKMWANYEFALMEYYNEFYTFCATWHLINFKKLELIDEHIHHPIKYPPWLGNEQFHYSHRCNLLRKSLINKELAQNLAKQGILLEGHDLNTPYYWPTYE